LYNTAINSRLRYLVAKMNLKVSRIQLIVILIGLFLIGSQTVNAAQPPNGVPFNDLWEALNEIYGILESLQTQISNIELTPGPEGPQGEQGIQGEPGEPGIDSASAPDYDTGWVDIDTWYPTYNDPTIGYFGYVDDSFSLESENFYVVLMERYELEPGVFVYHDREDVDWVYAEGQNTANVDPPPTDHALMIYSAKRASNDPPLLTHQARLMLWYIQP
jgi:hypothetical protein